MNRLALLLAVLTSTAAACPVRSGFFANGQFRDSTDLIPLCTPEFRKLAAQVKSSEYSEIYKTDLTAAGVSRVARAIGLFTSNRWKPSAVQNVGKNKIYGFQKGDKQSVIVVRRGAHSVLVVLIGDK